MTPATPKPIRLIRILRVGLHMAWGVFLAGIVFRIVPKDWHKNIAQRWSQKILGILRVECSLHGDMPTLDTRGVIMVSNHMSWLDIWLLYAIRPPRFISKADVRGWPVVGYLAQQSGTLFIQRERRHHTAAIVKQAAELLQQGDCVGLFPEGTTSDGTLLRPFHASLFQAAVIHQAPVMLFTIRYHLPDGSIDTAPAYQGNMTLLDSFRAVLARRRILVDITCLGTLDTHGKTRREISIAAETAIAKHLNLPAPHKTPEIPADLPVATPTSDHPTDSPYPAPHADSPH